MLFSDILATLPSTDHLSAIELSNQDKLIARIENKPGSAGSVRVYHALFQEFGEINHAAANKGLEIYAEHTKDAIAFPGKHPNIDRLLEITTAASPADAELSLVVKLIPA
ncbi:DUF2322 family protein [Undibacterium sp. Di24W]|uniref:DUF2322 family protein n=1 Tax=Undibacterium sp. Di24W TaxID=3413033 RepID=UPI003BF1C470